MWLVIRYVTMLQKLGFASRSGDWMLLRVATVNYFMLINIDLFRFYFSFTSFKTREYVVSRGVNGAEAGSTSQKDELE